MDKNLFKKIFANVLEPIPHHATTIHKIFETDFIFHVKQRTTGKVYFLFFKSFLLVLTKLSFWQGDWILGYHSMSLRYFTKISLFPKV